MILIECILEVDGKNLNLATSTPLTAYGPIQFTVAIFNQSTGMLCYQAHFRMMIFFLLVRKYEAHLQVLTSVMISFDSHNIHHVTSI